MKKYPCNWVKFLREKEGWSQKSLAFMCGCSRETIRLVENGKQMPSLELGFKMARIFDVRVESLFYQMYDECIDLPCHDDPYDGYE